jgi:N-acetylneuraminic acid mutarotase
MKERINSNSRAPLIRGTLYLLLLLTICAVPFALAQSRSRGISKRSVLKPLGGTIPVFNPASDASGVTQGARASTGKVGGSAAGLPATSDVAAHSAAIAVRINTPMPQPPDVVLYSQLDNPGTSATSSQEFPDSPTFTDFAADDFVVPAGQIYFVDEVDVQGIYFNGAGPADNFNVFFYRYNFGLPGTQVYSATGRPYVNSGGLFRVMLPSEAVLLNGAYWVSVQAHMALSSGGQWGWTDRTVTSNSPASWQNPGGGFGACPNWHPRTTCVGDPAAPDQMFALMGSFGGITPTVTPTATCTPAWQNEPSMPVGRAFASAAVASNFFYVISGFNGVSYQVDNDYFNGSVWASAAPIPVGHSQSRAATVGNNIYVPGGYNSLQFSGPIDLMQIYNSTTNTWSNGMNLPGTRSGAAVVAFERHVYIIGGFTAPFPTGTDTVYIYDPVTNSYTMGAPMPAPAGNVAGALLDNEIFVVGGSTSATLAHYAYNPATNTWNTIAAPSPPDCEGGGAFAFHDELWLFGCLGEPGMNVNIYSPWNNSWRAGPPLRVSQEGGSANGVYNARGLVAGGGTNGNPSTTVESIGPFCPTATPTTTPTATPTATVTATPTLTATVTPTATSTPTGTPTLTPRPSPTPRFAPTPRVRPTPPPRP